MGNFLSFFFPDKKKSYEKHGDVLKTKMTTKEQRLEAIEVLEKAPADLAIPQMLKRFEMVIDSGLQDSKEKERCLDFIVKNKDAAVTFIEQDLKTKARVSWLIKIAEKIFDSEKYVDLLLSLLKTESDIFDEDTLEKNSEILLALKDVKQERIIEKAKLFLSSRDEHVRISALECLQSQATAFDQAKQIILNLANDTITDSNSRFMGVVHEIIKRHHWA